MLYKLAQADNSYTPFTVNRKQYTGRFIMLSVITNIYNTKTKGPALM